MKPNAEVGLFTKPSSLNTKNAARFIIVSMKIKLYLDFNGRFPYRVTRIHFNHYLSGPESSFEDKDIKMLI
jgi:hypothetical protein